MKPQEPIPHNYPMRKLNLIFAWSSLALLLFTGVMVMYADEESFSLMTPEGHPIAGWITFSAHKDGDDTVVQVQSLVRAADPIYELGERLGAHKVNDEFWRSTVASFAGHFGVSAPVEMKIVLVDPKVQWAHARNVWKNAGLRTGLHMIGAPLRALRRPRG